MNCFPDEPKDGAKWRKRASVEDMETGPKRPQRLRTRIPLSSLASAPTRNRAAAALPALEL